MTPSCNVQKMLVLERSGMFAQHLPRSCVKFPSIGWLRYLARDNGRCQRAVKSVFCRHLPDRLHARVSGAGHLLTSNWTGKLSRCACLARHVSRHFNDTAATVILAIRYPVPALQAAKLLTKLLACGLTILSVMCCSVDFAAVRSSTNASP